MDSPTPTEDVAEAELKTEAKATRLGYDRLSCEAINNGYVSKASCAIPERGISSGLLAKQDDPGLAMEIAFKALRKRSFGPDSESHDSGHEDKRAHLGV